MISPETKERVQRIARKMGYTPNAIARGLVTKRTSTIGLVVTTIADPFVGEVAQGVEETALDNGYHVILCECNAQPERELASVRMLREKCVDAVIVTASRVGSLYAPMLSELGIPVLLINNQQEGHYLYSVRTDDLHGGHLVGELLASLGHRRIAYISGPPDAYSRLERLEGCRAALHDHGLIIPEEWVVPGDGWPSGGEAGVQALLRCSPRPTAIYCYDDVTAIGALRGAKSAGLRVPGDLSIIGFDDIAFAAFVDPPLTTVAQAKYTLGQYAMQLVLRLLREQQDVEDILLTPKLVVRESCAPPPRE